MLVLHCTILSVRIRKNKEEHFFVCTQMEIHCPKKQNVAAVWIDNILYLLITIIWSPSPQGKMANLYTAVH